MFDWITDRIAPSPLSQHGMADDEMARRERQQTGRESRETAARVNRVVDTWNERYKESWGQR